MRILEAIEDQERLLSLARATAEADLSGKPIPSVPPGSFSAVDCGGVFVTFWHGERLRGCVGTFGPVANLARTVQAATRSSLRDARFATSPITVAELGKLEMEVSLLSEPLRVSQPASLIPGVHGIIVKRGDRSGCFLPKVALEHGWSAEKFLSCCCTMKAGLPEHSWREPGTEVYVFTAQSIRGDALD
ncbi:MAG: AmmeMemoRadiSam system protein A [Planctomycetota bacterium]